ncbi:MAG: response regulator [Acidobacteriota bacterium]
MAPADATVWVVDDDGDVRAALALLLRSAGYGVRECAGGHELLRELDPESRGCILLDVRMPGMSGFEVQRELARRPLAQPVVFLSGHGDIPLAVKAVRAGALDFLEKPIRERELLAAISNAIAADARRRVKEERRREARTLLASLSRREAEVAELIGTGLTTREIADRLGLSPRTVEMHRQRLRTRVGAATSAEAVRIILGMREAAGEQGT